MKTSKDHLTEDFSKEDAKVNTVKLEQSKAIKTKQVKDQTQVNK